MRESTPAIDVRDEVAGSAGTSRHGEVHKIVRHEIRLRRAAASLQNDAIEIAEQRIERGHDGGPEAGTPLEPGCRG
jgi:hypothetical protein